jgi:hypothetical protein
MIAPPKTAAPSAPPPLAAELVARWPLLALLGGLGILLVLAMFDPAQHGFFPRCAFHSATGWECPGCGGQRAAHHLLRGHVAQALQANALVVVILPALIWLVVRWWLGRRGGPRLPALFLNRTCFWLLLALLVGFSLLRNLPAFAWLRP